MLEDLKSKINEAFSSDTEPTKKEKLEIDVEQILDFVEDKNEEFQEKLDKRTHDSFELLNKKRKILKENIDSLKEAKVNPEAIPRLKKAVKTNKKELIERLENLYNNTQISKNGDFEKLKEMTDDLMKQLEETSNNTNRNFMFVGKLLKDKSNKLRSNLKNIEDVVREYQDFLEENSEKFTFKKKIQNYINEIKALEDKIKGLDEEKINKKIEKREELINNVKDELKELKNGELKKRVEGLKSKINNLKEKRKKIETQIRKELSDLRKAFKKYRYKISLEGMDETFLGMYINSPIKALEKDESNSYLKGFLNDVEKFVSGKELNLDEKRSNKVREKISEIRDGFLKNKMDERDDLIRKIGGKENELDSLDYEEKLGEKKQELEKAREKLDDLKDKLKNMKSEKKSAKKRIFNIKNEMENLMERVLNRDVEVN